MTLKALHTTIDCGDPSSLARFWAEALHYEVTIDFDGFFIVLSPPEGGQGIGLQQVPEAKSTKNRVHLDLGTDDMVAEVQRLVALGATKVTEQSVPGLSWTVLTDPEGNEFCVAQHGD
jgi:predicted enzyme related to lactoylglutathione lyase